MQDEIEKTLREIGGDRLVQRWSLEDAQTPTIKLPTAYLDKLAIGYAIALGAIAASVDLVMDQAFRNEMVETHRVLAKGQRTKLENAVKDRIKELGVFPDKGEIRRLLQEAGVEIDPNYPIPDSAMDCYHWLNEKIGLNFPLCPKNHRILNHSDASAVIAMLMKGEAGLGDLLIRLYPGMAEGAAREIYNLHVAADRHTSSSLPLKIMSWLWEQGVRSQNPDTVGSPNFLFALLKKFAPNIDWAGWINAFCDKDVVPKGTSIGEAMLKLYEAGVLNERAFWTSDLGAAVGGVKRRVVIAATMEAGVEIFSLFEGVSLGFLNWSDGAKQFAAAYLDWRDQPKYLDMRTLAQAIAAAGPAARALWTGDALSQNLPSLAMMMKHLWTAADVSRRHTDHLITVSKSDSANAIEDFVSATHIRIRPPLALIEGGKSMTRSFEQRLDEAGCLSTRVCVLVSRHAVEMESIVIRIEHLAKIAQGDVAKAAAFDAICETWYLSDTTDDAEALHILKEDVGRLEKKFGC
ncbi:MAG: hypothetical protein WCC64_09610 [Aliidongia sp.]